MTCDIGAKNCSDMGHSHFLNPTCDIGGNKRQGHATLPFLKIDMRHWGAPIKGPINVCHFVTSHNDVKLRLFGDLTFYVYI